MSGEHCNNGCLFFYIVPAVQQPVPITKPASPVPEIPQAPVAEVKEEKSKEELEKEEERKKQREERVRCNLYMVQSLVFIKS